MLARPKPSKYIVLSGNSHPELARLICHELDRKLGNCKLYFRTNLETHLELVDSVRGCNVFIVQTGSDSVNNDIMETCILSYACKSCSCAKVILVMPYVPYSRHCKRSGRSSIECQLVARMFKESGVDMLLTVDLFTDELQGFFELPVENLRASTLMLRHLKMSIGNLSNFIVVALDARSVHRASYFASELGVLMAFVHCRNRVNDQNIVQCMKEKTIEQTRLYHLVGDVTDKQVIIVGNLIDDSDRLTEVVKLLHKKGAKSTTMIASHGLIYDLKMDQVENSAIDKFILTNSLPILKFTEKYSKLEVMDISQLLSEAIRRIHNEESLSGLYLHTDLQKTQEDDD